MLFRVFSWFRVLLGALSLNGRIIKFSERKAAGLDGLAVSVSIDNRSTALYLPRAFSAAGSPAFSFRRTAGFLNLQIAEQSNVRRLPQHQQAGRAYLTVESNRGSRIEQLLQLWSRHT